MFWPAVGLYYSVFKIYLQCPLLYELSEINNFHSIQFTQFQRPVGCNKQLVVYFSLCKEKIR